MKNCQPESLCVLAGLFNIYLKKCCFRVCSKVTTVLFLFKGFGNPGSLLSIKCKIFQKFITNTIVDCLVK